MFADKSESLADQSRSIGHQHGKSVQVKVSPGSGGGGSNSPQPSSANARMTPPDEGSAKPPVVPMQQAVPHTMMPYFHFQPTPPLHVPAATAPPGLLGQYADPKADVGMIGVVHNNTNAATANNNANNNYTTEAAPIMSTGLPMRPALLQTGCGRAPHFKAGQPPQPAHTNNLSVLQGKNLMAMPAEPKPGSPVVPMPPYVGPQMEGVAGGGPQRLPLYQLPYGRGQGGSISAAPAPVAAPPHLPPMHQAQPGVLPFPLVTRSVQTTLPGSASVMTVSASHPVTVVTATHPTAATATGVHRSPSHNGNGSLQRDSGNESISGGGGGSVMSEASLRSSPLQVAGGGGGGGAVTQVAAAAPSPPMSHHAGCQLCAQGSPYSHGGQYGAVVYPPYPYIMPNGLMPHSAMSGYYGSQPLASAGVLTNGYSPDMYPPYPGYPSLNPATAGHVYPMMHSNALYPGTPPAQPAVPPSAAPPGNNGPPTVLPQQQPPPPAAVGGGGGLVAAGQQQQQQASSVAIKQRNTGCYNCGSRAHKSADCTESSMEMMSGRAVYLLDYKPPEESD